MTFQELQKQALQLPTSDSQNERLCQRWQLVQTLLESLKRENPTLKRGNLSRLRGIAKSSVAVGNLDSNENYVTYLVEKYQ